MDKVDNEVYIFPPFFEIVDWICICIYLDLRGFPVRPNVTSSNMANRYGGPPSWLTLITHKQRY